MFSAFVDTTTTEVGGRTSETTLSVGCPTGSIDPKVSTDHMFTLFNLLNKSTGNPTNIVEDNSNGSTNTKLVQDNFRARPNSRSYSSFTTSNRSSRLRGKELFRYILITRDSKVVTFFSPYKVKMNRLLYDEIVLNLED